MLQIPTTYNHLQLPPTTSNHQAENPADLAAIAEAERNMGDFKLKTDAA